MKDYRYDSALRIHTNGYRASIWVVYSPNGHKIAECWSDRMARKIIKGLKLQDEHHSKTKKSIGS